jgi:hypothetical protein
MILMSNGSQIWGEQYQRKASDIATLQDDIASDISGRLRMKVSGSSDEKKHATENADAYQLYVKGRFYMAQRTRESIYKALDQFNQAVAKDPNYAQAYAGLAYAYILLFDRGWISPDEASPKILASARESLCRGLGSRWFTERFHRNALVTHFQHGQVCYTARQLKDYAVTRCGLHQRAPQR